MEHKTRRSLDLEKKKEFIKKEKGIIIENFFKKNRRRDGFCIKKMKFLREKIKKKLIKEGLK